MPPLPHRSIRSACRNVGDNFPSDGRGWRPALLRETTEMRDTEPSDYSGQEDHKQRHKPDRKRCKQKWEQHQPQREIDYHPLIAELSSCLTKAMRRPAFRTDERARHRSRSAFPAAPSRDGLARACGTGFSLMRSFLPQDERCRVLASPSVFFRGTCAPPLDIFALQDSGHALPAETIASRRLTGREAGEVICDDGARAAPLRVTTTNITMRWMRGSTRDAGANEGHPHP